MVTILGEYRLSDYNYIVLGGKIIKKLSIHFMIICLATLFSTASSGLLAEHKKVNSKQMSNQTDSKSDIGTVWDKLSDKDKELYKENLLLLMLEPYLHQSINKYYGENRQYDNAEIIYINPISLKQQIEVQVTTFKGPHNPTYGLETITLELECGKLKVTY